MNQFLDFGFAQPLIVVEFFTTTMKTNIQDNDDSISTNMMMENDDDDDDDAIAAWGSGCYHRISQTPTSYYLGGGGCHKY